MAEPLPSTVPSPEVTDASTESQRSPSTRLAPETGKSSREKPGVLVLSSGGVKGLGIIGALITLEREGYLEGIHTIVGTSVGAVIGLLMVAGCTLYEIMELGLRSKVLCPWKEMHKVDTTLFVTYGPVPHEKTVQETADVIAARFGGRIPTMKELYDRTGKRMVMVTGCLGDSTGAHRGATYIDHHTHPDMPCISGMTASMLLAGILSKFMYEGMLYVDGAFVDPYPACYLDDGVEYTIGLAVIGVDSDPNASYSAYLIATMSLSFDRIQTLSAPKLSDRVSTIELRLPEISIMDKGSDVNLRLKCFNAGVLYAMQGIARLKGMSYEAYYGLSVLPTTYTDVPTHEVKHHPLVATPAPQQRNRFTMALSRIPMPRFGGV